MYLYVYQGFISHTAVHLGILLRNDLLRRSHSCSMIPMSFGPQEKFYGADMSAGASMLGMHYRRQQMPAAIVTAADGGGPPNLLLLLGYQAAVMYK